MNKLPLRARLATSVGGAASKVSRLAGRGDGSVIGGVIGLRLEPGLLAMLAQDRQVVLVTGTNGKTTTTRLVTAALAPLGEQIASNAFGANMEAGMASALGQAPEAAIAVLECDEKYIPPVLKATHARVLVLLNLSRDQMDRAAEIWLLARRWREAIAAAPDCHVVANADDPLIAWAAAEAPHVTWVAAGQRWHDDSWCCPRCGSHLRRTGDDWKCGECSFTRPPVRWALSGEDVIDPAGRVRPLDLALPDVVSVAGRYTTVERRGVAIRLLLAKNPAGWLEALDVLRPPPEPVMLAVNAQVPDGRDTSWLWDVDYRRLRGRQVFVGGERRTDLAVRLEADEVAFEIVAGIDGAVDRVGHGSLEVIGNYTAFQQIRTVLGRAA
jgi:UDP-N-acetylmuramyl tripeptide synthase